MAYKKSSNNFRILIILLISLVVLLISSFSLSFFDKIRDSDETFNSKEETDVLGTYKDLHISSTKGSYRRSGLINLSSIEEPSIFIESNDLEDNTAWLEIYKANKNQLLDYFIRDSENQQVNTEVNKDEMTLVKAYDIELENGDAKAILPLENEGIWYIEVTADSLSSNSFVTRSRAAVLSYEGNSKIVYWAQDLETGRTINEGALSIYSLLNDVNELEEVSVSSGTGESQIYAEADIGVFDYGESTAVVPINLKYLNSSYRYREFQPNQTSKRFFLYTDRPIYKPGDEVFFKAIVRDDKDGIYTIPQGSLDVRSYKGWDYREENIFRESFLIDSYGTTYGSFILNENIEIGSYTLRVADPLEENEYATIQFDVENYRKPEYTIDITNTPQEYVRGEDLSVNVQAQYFSGQPLTDVSGEYTLHLSDYYSSTYLPSENYLDNYGYYYWRGEEEMQGRFDIENGQSVINIDTSKYSFDHPKIFSVEVSYTDDSGNPTRSRKNFLVFPANYSIYAKDYIPSTRVGESINIPLVLIGNRQNTTLAGKSLEVSVKRIEWVKKQDDSTKWGYRYEKVEEELPNTKIVTDSNGEALLQYASNQGGSYEFTIKSRDDKGNIVSKVFRSWVYSPSEYSYFGSYEPRVSTFSVQSDKQNYNVGEEAAISIYSSGANKDAFVTLERGFMHEYAVVSFDNSTNVKEVAFDIEEYAVPNVDVSVLSFNDSNLEKNSITLEVSKDSKEINVNIEPDSRTYGPGEAVNLDITTTDNTGTPVSADVGIWAVDKAIYELSDANYSNILNTFWPRRRSYTAYSHSLEGISVYAAEQGGCFIEGTEITMEDGSKKKIEDIKAGDFVLSKDPLTGIQKGKKVISTHEEEETTLLVINNSIKTTPNHFLYVNNIWKTAGDIQKGDILTNSSNEEILVKSMELIKGDYKVYNLEVEDFHTYYANGYLVHNQKGGVSRDTFEDMAYWNPSVRTDVSGKANLSFELPDNLTTWVINSFGHTLDTKVGEQREEIVVSKDIIFRPILPNILRTDEEIVISGLAQNFTDSTINMAVGIEFENGELLSKESFLDEFEPNETKQYFWKVKPTVESEEAEITFYVAREDDTEIGDRVVSTIPIKKFGFYENKSFISNEPTNYNIDLKNKIDISKSSITLNLSNSLVGSLPSAMEYLIAYPYGCVEQTTSRFVPLITALENPALFSEFLNDKDVEDMVNTGVERLQELQKDDGGWTWWFSGNSELFITSYVIEYLLLAEELGYDVPNDILDKAKNYLSSTDYENIPDNASKSYKERVLLSVYGLGLDGTENRIIPLSILNEMNNDLLALGVIHNLTNGYEESSNNGLDLLMSRAKSDSTGIYWEGGESSRFGSIEASTALSLRALLLSGQYTNEAASAYRFLNSHRETNYWRNTYATAQVIRAISEFEKYESTVNSSYNYTVVLDNKEIDSGTFGQEDSNFTLNIDPDEISNNGSTLQLLREGEGTLYSTLSINEFITDREVNSFSSGVSIEREYVNSKGHNYSIGLGDTVTVKLTVNGLKVNADYAVIHDYLPSGLIPINENLKNEPGSTSRYYWAQDRKEYGLNEVKIPINHITAGSNTFSYTARVVSFGDFYVPPAQFSLMYSPEVNAHSGVSVLNVKEDSVKLFDIARDIRDSVNFNKSEGNNAFNIILLTYLILSTVTLLALFVIKKNSILQDRLMNLLNEVITNIKDRFS